MSRLSTKQGFTLIEFLVAAFLLGIVGVALTSVMRNSIRTWTRAEKELRLLQEAQASLDLIGREFQNALDVPGIVWSVKDQEVVFATLKNETQILKVTYKIANALQVLERTEESLTPDKNAVPIVSALTTHPTELEWEYAYRGGTVKDEVRWEKEWKQRDDLPAGLRIRMTLRDAQQEPHTFTRTLFSPARGLP